MASPDFRLPNLPSLPKLPTLPDLSNLLTDHSHVLEVIPIDIFAASFDARRPSSDVAEEEKAAYVTSLCCIRHPALLYWDELLGWQKDNELITSKYRPKMTFHRCLASLFYLHNETGNIWTHLLGFFGVLFLVGWSVVHDMPEIELAAHRGDNMESLSGTLVSYYGFICGAMVMFLCSTILHTFLCMSSRACALCTRLDYVGIAMMILGSNIPLCFHFFTCEVWARSFWIALIACCSVCASIVSCLDFFATPRFRYLRAGTFLLLGLLGVGPTMHWVALPHYGPKALTDQRDSILVLLGTMGLSYIVGACMFALRIPERFHPGSFDLVGQSHQIFHTLVLVGATIMYFAVRKVSLLFLEYQHCSYYDNLGNSSFTRNGSLTESISEIPEIPGF